MADTDIRTTTIAAGAALSAQIDIGTKSLVGIVIPANWTPAPISFQVSMDGGTTWVELTPASTGVPYVTGGTNIAVSTYVAIDPTILRGIASYKVRSGTAASAANQTSTVTLQLVTRMVF